MSNRPIRIGEIVRAVGTADAVHGEALDRYIDRGEEAERLLRAVVEGVVKEYQHSPFYKIDEWREARAFLGLPVAKR